jgi:GNAT superfamily N-acetyltransferase
MVEPKRNVLNKSIFMIKILDYTTDYKTYFDSLNRVWIEKYFTMEPLDEFVLTHPEEAVLAKGGAILFASYDEVICGVVALIKVTEHTYEFAKMGVHQDFRRKGIAEALSKAAFEKAKELNANNIVLFSNTKLEPAIQLYRKLGFREVPLGDLSEYKRSNIKMELVL